MSNWTDEASITPETGIELNVKNKDEDDKLNIVYPVRLSKRLNDIIDRSSTAMFMTKQQWLRKIISENDIQNIDK